MKTIPLTRGYVALVDDDFQWGHLKWRAHFSGNGGGPYARTTMAGSEVYMHRLVAGASVGSEEVDHRDNNGLNNQRENLRSCSDGQQSMNRPKGGGFSSSRFKGVSWDKERSRWRAGIRFNKYRHLGRFKSEIEAAAAYDRAARELFGEFAWTNQVTTMKKKFRRRWLVLIKHHDKTVCTAVFKTAPAAFDWAAEYVLKLRGVESFEASALTAMEQVPTAEEVMEIWWHMQESIGTDHKIEILKSKQYS